MSAKDDDDFECVKEYFKERPQQKQPQIVQQSPEKKQPITKRPSNIDCGDPIQNNPPRFGDHQNEPKDNPQDGQPQQTPQPSDGQTLDSRGKEEQKADSIVEIGYSIKKYSSKANPSPSTSSPINVEVLVKDYKLEKIVYVITITNGNNKIEMSKHFHNVKELEENLRKAYGDPVDIGLISTIEDTDRQYAGYHIIPYLDKKESIQDSLTGLIGKEADDKKKRKVEDREVKIRLFLLKVLDNSILSESSVFKKFIAEKEPRVASTMQTRIVKKVNENFYTAYVTMKEYINNSEDPEVKGLKEKHEAMTALKSQLEAYQGMIEACSDVMVESYCKQDLTDIDHCLLYVEDICDSLWSLVMYRQHMVWVAEKLHKCKVDSDRKNIKIYLANSNSYYAEEHNAIEKNMKEDISFVVSMFQEVVCRMIDIKEK